MNPVTGATSSIHLFRHEEKVYIKVWRKGELLFAEVLFAPAAEDLLYFVTAIKGEIPRCPRTVVASQLTDTDVALLKRYYKVVCES